MPALLPVRSMLVVLLLATVVTSVTSLSFLSPPQSDQHQALHRRAFCRSFIVGVQVPFLLSAQPAAVVAYERRDVGGEGRSAETAAFNEQAYETNNRLEQSGFKLETQQEQKASLTAALADYSYSPSSASTKGNAGSNNKNKNNNKPTSQKAKASSQD